MARGGRVRSVSVRVRADISDFEKKMLSAKKTMKKFGSQMEQQGKTMTKLFTLPFLAATAAIAKLTSSTMAYADEIDKMSVRTGISVERLQELKYVADQMGVSFEAVQTSTTALLRGMNQADKGVGDAAEAFKRLKIEVKENGAFRNTADVYEETIRKLGKMGNGTEQAALALKLFGRQAQEILPFIRAGGEGIDKLIEKYRKLGLGLDKDTIDKFVRLKDTIATVKTQFANVGMTIATAFLPIVEKIAEFVGERIVPAFQKLSSSLGGINKNFIVIAGIFAGVLAVVGPLMVGFGMLVKVLALLSVKVLAIPLLIAGLATALIVLAKTNEGVANALRTVWDGLKTFFKGVADFFKKVFGNMALTTNTYLDFIVGTISAALRIIGNVFAAFGNLLQGNWSGLWQNVKDIFEDIGRFLVSKAGLIVKPILAIFEAMATHITDKIFMWLGKKLESWINKSIGLANSAIGLLNKIPGVDVGTIKGSVKFSPDVMPSDIVKGFRGKIDDLVNKYGMQEKVDLKKFKDIFNFNLDGFGGLDKLKDTFEEIEDAGTSAYKALTDGVKGYIDALRQQTDAFANFTGIFDRFERTQVSGGRLLSRMKAQVKAMGDWRDALGQLESRGVGQGFVNMLREMGPSQVDAIKALARMSDSQLSEYQSLYGEKSNIAGQQASAFMSGQKMADTIIESQINITVANSNIKSEDDVEIVARQIVQKLKLAGIRV